MHKWLIAVLTIAALIAVAGCGGGGNSSAPDYKAETKAVEIKLAEAEAEEAACVELLPENEAELRSLDTQLSRGRTVLPLAEAEEIAHDLELEVRDESNCIEEEQELEIDLNHRLGYLSEAEEGFAARKANEKAATE